MLRFLSLLRYLIVFFALISFALPGFCQKEKVNIEHFLVSFVPPITVHNGDHFLNCAGVILSPEYIALTSACAGEARELRQSGNVAVQDYQGDYIGQLPAINNLPLEELQAFLEPGRQVPFVSDLKPDDAFPSFVDVRDLALDNHTADTYYLVNPVAEAGTEDSQPLPVQLKALSSGKDVFSLSGESADLLEQYPVGSPVVDSQGGVMCMLADSGGCESVAVKGVAINDNDGSCRIPYFECDNAAWSWCNSGSGAGNCTNAKSHETCLVSIVPNLEVVYLPDGSTVHCKNSDGCGGVSCPYGCGNNCDCAAAWGFAEQSNKIDEAPDQCLPQAAKSNDFRHSSAFLGVAIGVPAGVVATVIMTVAVIAVAYKKMSKRGAYEVMQ